MRKFLLGMILLFTTALLGAQEESDGRKSAIQLRGFAYAHFEGIDRLELRHEGNTVGELFLPTGQLRKRSPVSARTFSYGVTQAEKFRLLGSVVLPEVGRDFILVMTPIQNGYKAFPVRADDPNFRGDDTMLFNFTKYKLAILLGDGKFKVNPWANALLRPSFDENATFYQAMFAYEKNGSFQVFNNTRWPVNVNTKALVFVFHDQPKNQLVYRSVTELAEQ
jgi:hypothetical protein